jgi:hypothetical protein
MHALLVVLATATPHPINAVVGDVSVIAGYVDADADEDSRIAGHLRFAHDLLAATDTSAWPASRRVARANNLARLDAYIAARRFPRNDDHPDARRPTFVDRGGAICAVGALFAADRGRGAAVRIAAAHKYDFIVEIDDAELAAWQRDSGLSMAELAIIQPAYAWPPLDRGMSWMPPALLDRMQEGPDRYVAATEVFSGGLSFTLHGQTKLPFADINYGYATVPLAIADAAVQTAAAGGSVATRQTALENSEVGMYFAHKSNPFLGGFGVVIPTGPDVPFAAMGARVGDAVLGMSRATGIRGTVAMRDSLILGGCGACSFHTRVAVRAEAGVDGVETLVDGQWHAIPRGGLGVAYGDERYELLAETAIAYAPLALGDSHMRWSAGLTGRGGIGTERRRVEAGLTLAAIHDITGWGSSLTLELAFTNARRRDW